MNSDSLLTTGNYNAPASPVDNDAELTTTKKKTRKKRKSSGKSRDGETTEEVDKGIFAVALNLNYELTVMVSVISDGFVGNSAIAPSENINRV